MEIDTSNADEARAWAEQVEAEAAAATAAARAAYYAAVADLVDRHGATSTARALGITRARVYQIKDKLKG